jgi:G patch domain-containing protein 1
MLGEVPLPSAPRSVFEYISQKDRERLQKFAAGGGIVSPATSDLPPSTTVAPSEPDTIRIPRTEPHIAQAALRGFQPFATDPVKQSRYNAYLQSQASQDSSVPPLKPSPGQRIDEFNKELEDYAKSALIFKPISGAMAGRFTSAVVFDSGPKIHEGLHTPSSEELAEKEREEKKKEDNISPKQHAAKMGMYGPLTRETKPWQPARLLCKRFGVKDPNPTPSDAPAAAPPGPNWQQEESEVAGQASNTSVSNSTIDTARRNGPRDLANIGLGEDETQGRDTLTYERPAMDVFKAIFASDDEDSDEEAKKDDDEGEEIGDGDGTAFEPPVQADKTDVLQSGVSILPVAESTAASETTMVDLSSFKPTFVPRDKKSKDNGKDNGKDKDRKEKKRKEKTTVLVSFEMDEEGGGVSISKPPKDRPKKKKRKDKQKHGDEGEDGMWVEKPTSEAVKDLLLPKLTSDQISAMDESAGPVKGRKRAIDFM